MSSTRNTALSAWAIFHSTMMPSPTKSSMQATGRTGANSTIDAGVRSTGTGTSSTLQPDAVPSGRIVLQSRALLRSLPTQSACSKRRRGEDGIGQVGAPQVRPGQVGIG